MNVFLVFFILFFNSFSSFYAIKNDRFCDVKRVIDGDTFVVENGSEKGEKIRLIGVDAPETRNSARRKIGYYGVEAKAYLNKLLRGKRVRLQLDVSKKDRYGRTLAYVYVGEVFVSADLIKRGYAHVFTVPPNIKYAQLFVELEREARQRNRGLWKR